MPKVYRSPCGGLMFALLLAVFAGFDSFCDASATGTRARIESTEDFAGNIERRLASLRSAIEQLENGDRALDEARSEELRRLTDIVRAQIQESTYADAALRPVTGGGSGFTFGDADGRFSLRLSGQVQLRFAWSHQPGAATDTDQYGFETRRIKLKAQGHVFSKDIEYAIGGSFDRDGGVFEISDTFIDWHVDDAWTLRAGNFRPAFLREDALSAKRLPMIERSLVRSAFGEDRRVGIAATWQTDSLRLTASWLDDAAGFDDENGWRARGRAEGLLSGTWRDQHGATGFIDDEQSLMIGAGIGYDDDRQLPGAVEANALTWTADMTWQDSGVSALAAVVGRELQIAGSPDPSQIGAIIQGGVFISQRTELVARYEWGDADDGTADLSLITAGVNHYFNRHNLKVAADIGYAFNAVVDSWASSGAAWRADPPGSNGQIVVRTQFQLLF